MKSLGLLFCTLLFVALAALAAKAEQVTLKNGDKITGAVVKSDGKTLVFKTDYAGDLSISWAPFKIFHPRRSCTLPRRRRSWFLARLRLRTAI